MARGVGREIHSRARGAHLARHRIVVQAASQTIGLEDYAKGLEGFPAEIPVTLKINVSSAYYWSIAKGAGIGEVGRG